MALQSYPLYHRLFCIFRTFYKHGNRQADGGGQVSHTKIFNIEYSEKIERMGCGWIQENNDFGNGSKIK